MLNRTRQRREERREPIHNPDSLVTVRELRDQMDPIHSRFRDQDKALNRLQILVAVLVATGILGTATGKSTADVAKGAQTALVAAIQQL